MKKNILLLVCILTILCGQVFAQSGASGSRLNMGQKKKAVVENNKFSNVSSPLRYKPLSIQNPAAINNFYRTYLFNTPTLDNNVLAAESIEKVVENRIPVPSSIFNAEEQLFANDKISVSNIYPNPASEYAELDYSMQSPMRDVKVTFYSILGTVMKEYPLAPGEKKLRVNTREMPTGLYFYQLALDGKKVATKKMLVRHQQ